jgi:predicted phage terminase large subunit-like protein
MVQRWRPALWALEKGQITSGVGPFLRARMRERRCHTGLEEFPVRYDKATRAQSIRGRMELRGGLYVPAKASWLSDVKSELLAFPTGRNDDIVDALALCGQLIDRWCAGPQPINNVVRFRSPKDFKDYCVESELEGDSNFTLKML